MNKMKLIALVSSGVIAVGITTTMVYNSHQNKIKQQQQVSSNIEYDKQSTDKAVIDETKKLLEEGQAGEEIQREAEEERLAKLNEEQKADEEAKKKAEKEASDKEFAEMQERQAKGESKPATTPKQPAPAPPKQPSTPPKQPSTPPPAPAPAPAPTQPTDGARDQYYVAPPSSTGRNLNLETVYRNKYNASGSYKFKGEGHTKIQQMLYEVAKGKSTQQVSAEIMALPRWDSTDPIHNTTRPANVRGIIAFTVQKTKLNNARDIFGEAQYTGKMVGGSGVTATAIWYDAATKTNIIVRIEYSLNIY